MAQACAADTGARHTRSKNERIRCSLQHPRTSSILDVSLATDSDHARRSSKSTLRLCVGVGSEQSAQTASVATYQRPQLTQRTASTAQHWGGISGDGRVYSSGTVVIAAASGGSAGGGSVGGGGYLCCGGGGVDLDHHCLRSDEEQLQRALAHTTAHERAKPVDKGVLPRTRTALFRLPRTRTATVAPADCLVPPPARREGRPVHQPERLAVAVRKKPPENSGVCSDLLLGRRSCFRRWGGGGAGMLRSEECPSTCTIPCECACRFWRDRCFANVEPRRRCQEFLSERLRDPRFHVGRVSPSSPTSPFVQNLVFDSSAALARKHERIWGDFQLAWLLRNGRPRCYRLCGLVRFVGRRAPCSAGKRWRRCTAQC